MSVAVLCMHTWMEYPSIMECACTMHGIRLYHAWNTPVPRMEYACIMLGIRLYDAWNTPGTCTFHAVNVHIFMHGTCMKFRHQSMHACNMHVPYLKNVPNPCMLHACFRNHACNMHEISNYSITLSLEISCMELSGFGRMKCAETCMKHASFRRSILSRGALYM